MDMHRPWGGISPRFLEGTVSAEYCKNEVMSAAFVEPDLLLTLAVTSSKPPSRNYLIFSNNSRCLTVVTVHLGYVFV